LTARYRLEMISPKNDDSMNSTFGHRDHVDEQTARLTMNRSDAVPRGIQDGDLVRVFNDRGSCYFTARLSDDVTSGVVAARSVRWNKRSECGYGVNRLTSERLTDIGGGPTFYSCLVEVAPAG
jgi:anaerobic selenocysteine-containing dehydrogenase